ncbi:uncharacterized protein METZ01_LOCUS103920, partial [marine metagenome]
IMPTITLQEAETIIEGAKIKIQELGVRMAVSDDLAKSIGDEAGGNEADGETGDALAGFTNAGPRVVRGRDEPITVWTI